MHAAQQSRRSPPRSRPSCGPGSKQLREILNTSVHGFHHPAHDRAAFDDPAEERQRFYEKMWNSPGFTKLTSNYTDLLSNPDANAEWCAFIADKIREHRPRPGDRRAADPDGPPFRREAATLRHRLLRGLQPAQRVAGRSAEDPDGARHARRASRRPTGVREFDIIVWATGFDFGTGALSRMGIRGRDGLALADYWADGPRTFLGVQTHGFPNLFFPGGPHAAAGNNPRYNGDQVDFITDLLVYARDHGCDVVEVTERAEERWTRMIDRGAASPALLRREELLLRHQHPGEAEALPAQLRRPPEVLLHRRRRGGQRLRRLLDVAHERDRRRPALSRAGRDRHGAVTPWRSASPASPRCRASAAAVRSAGTGCARARAASRPTRGGTTSRPAARRA